MIKVTVTWASGEKDFYCTRVLTHMDQLGHLMLLDEDGLTIGACYQIESYIQEEVQPSTYPMAIGAN